MPGRISDDAAAAGRQPLVRDEQRNDEDDGGDGEAENVEGAFSGLSQGACGSAVRKMSKQHDQKAQRRGGSERGQQQLASAMDSSRSTIQFRVSAAS